MGGKRKIRNILFDKKAVSVVVSTIVLTAGVLAMGIAVLYWTYSWGSLASRAYSAAEENSVKAIQERLGFEYIDYSSSTNTLTVTLINWGDTNNITIADVVLSNSAHQIVGNYSRPQLMSMSNSPIAGLNMTAEGYFRIPQSLTPGFYFIRVVTDRGRTFDSTFAT
jgi:archaellum component FlaF (FlaF/FlaG flagellin family)